MSVREICGEKKLQCLNQSVAFALSSNLDCAIFRGVVRVILLNPTNVIVGFSTKLPEMKKMTTAIHTSLDNSDFTIPSLLKVVRLMVAVESVHLEECGNIFYLPAGWPQQMIELEILNSSRIDIFPGFFPSLYRNTSLFWYRSRSSNVAISSMLTVLR